MKHASAQTIAQLAPLLAQVRALPGLKEPKPGTFYRRAQAFLHFHEGPAGLFADAKLDLKTFTRMPVNTPAQQAALLAALAAALPR